MLRWPAEIYDYILNLSRFDDPLLKEMEERAQKENFPIIGPLIGTWAYLITRLSGALRVFEMGGGFGYSTWYFATAVRENGPGMVTHTVWDNDMSMEAQVYMERAGLLLYCDFLVSEAILALSSINPGIDLVFLDIDKEGYPEALSVIEQKLKPGGLLLADNVLWDGEVVGPEPNCNAGKAVKEFNRMLFESQHWHYSIIPLRDGLGVARLKD